MTDDPLLRVENLTTQFRTDQGLVRAVDGVSFDVARGETVCLVGESGSGKTVASESLTRLIDEPPGEITAGTVRFDGRDLLSLSDSALRAVRGGRIAHVFQHPQSALNPVYTVGWQLIEAVQLHADVSTSEARARAIDLLDRVGIPDSAGRIDDYPESFSGGQLQRIAIAMALAGDPDLLVADEPTTALDVTIQSQVLRLLEDLQAAFGLGILLVTHDLGVVAETADRVVVLYEGTVMERGDVYELFDRPSHPYTRALFDAIPGRSGRRFDLDRTESHSARDRTGRTGPAKRAERTERTEPATRTDRTVGCRFRDRCPHAVDACRTGEQPPLYDVTGAAESRDASRGVADSPPDAEETHVAVDGDHVVSCVHFAPDGDPGVVLGSDPDSVCGSDPVCDDDSAPPGGGSR